MIKLKKFSDFSQPQYFAMLLKKLSNLSESRLFDIYDFVAAPRSISEFEVDRSTVLAAIASIAESNNYTKLLKSINGYQSGRSWEDWLKSKMNLSSDSEFRKELNKLRSDYGSTDSSEVSGLLRKEDRCRREGRILN